MAMPSWPRRFLGAWAAVVVAASCAFPDFTFGGGPDEAGGPGDGGAEGGCARGCFGGSCVDSKCQPVTLYADREGGAGGIYVTDLDVVYFAQYAAGRVVGELPDGAISFVASGIANPVRVTGSSQGTYTTAYAGGDAAAGAAVVLLTSNGQAKRLVTGPLVAGLPIAPWGIVDTGRFLVWTNAIANGSVMLAQQDGRFPTVLYTGGRPGELAANAEFAWFVDMDRSQLYRVSLTLGTKKATLVTNDFVDTIAYAGGHLYTASFINTSGIGVIDNPTLAESTPVRELVSRNARLPGTDEPAAANPHDLAVDDTHVYWVNSPPQGGPTGSLVRMRLDGVGPPERLATGLERPDRIAVTSSAIYWTNFSGTVGRLAKP